MANANTINVDGSLMFRASGIVNRGNHQSITSYVEWPFAICKPADKWIKASIESHRAIDGCFVLLSYIHPQFRPLRTSEIYIDDFKYTAPTDACMIYDGIVHSIAWKKVLVTSNDGGIMWKTLSDQDQVPIPFTTCHLRLFDDSAVLARQALLKTHAIVQHAAVNAVVSEVAKIAKVPVKRAQQMHISDVQHNITSQVVDAIEQAITGHVGTSYRASLVAEQNHQTIEDKSAQLYFQLESVVGAVPLNELSYQEDKYITMTIDGVTRKLPQISGISYISGMYVSRVQVCCILEHGKFGYIAKAPPANSDKYLTLRNPSNKKARIDLFNCIEHAQSHNNLTTIHYGTQKLMYPTSWLAANHIISMESRNVYSLDSTTWEFLDDANDLSWILDSDSLNLIDPIKVYDSCKIINAAEQLLPLTNARYLLAERRASVKQTLEDTAFIQTHKMPVAFKLDYPIEEIAGFVHRCGWYYVIKHLLKAETVQKPKQILLIDFVEKTFGWSRVCGKDPYKNIYYKGVNYYVLSAELRYYFNNNVKIIVARIVKDVIVEWVGDWELCKVAKTDDEFETNTILLERTITEPWIGMWHNPHKMPSWFNYHDSPQELLKLANFQRSMKYCRGIIVLSEYFAEWVREKLPGIPVSVIYHPTEKPEKCFTMEAYRANKERCIIQIGYWLRNMCSIGRLNAPNHVKIWLYGSKTALTVHETECKEHLASGQPCSTMKDVHVLRLPDLLYDEVLACNPAFIWLYDSSANNGVIECIARGTPLLINRHPAVVEYLGEDYPGFCDNLDEVSAKLNDDTVIERMHVYLRDTPEVQERIKIERFLRDFALSDVVQNLASE
jgi:hypothetical protein